VRTFRAVVGKLSTPTPTGRFFVEETVQLGQSDAGAPYALALSARSGVFQEFEGGPGQIALHGTRNIGGVLGSGESHGCIRLDTRAITWLATWVAPGSLVTILP
jgi:lipoprotein-anchoring transpeptidase ErfK/SrfK